ncbi:MAG TPA: metallophosphoesterase family protein [Vicinamibacterales bacterium]
MRIAVVSDVHANLTALEAVIADLANTAPDLVVNGGDLLSGGSRPADVIDRIRGLGWPGVRGNTDEMLWRRDQVEATLAAPHFASLKKMVLGHVIPWTLEAIGDERRSWLQSLPLVWSHQGVAVTHAAPDDAWRSPGIKASDEELAQVYAPLEASTVVYGHIHHPFVRTIGPLTVVNSGSVSLSYDGDPRASYAIVERDRVEIRRIEYDIEEEIARLRAARDPQAEWIAQMLRSGSFVPLPA